MAGEWTVRPLEDCMAALIDYRGKTPQKTSFGIPLITAKVVKGGRIETPDEFIDVDDYERWMRRGIPKAGDVVITTEAPLGEVAQLGTERIALAQRLIALRGKSGVLDNGFLKFLMQFEDVQDQLRARASGTTVLGIKQSELRKVLLTLPPIDEQRAIAHILGTLDDKIELNRRMNETLEAMARALFKSWFVDFDPVRAKRRGESPCSPSDPGLPPHIAALFPDRFEDSELGEIPKGWRAGRFDDVLAELVSGARPKGGAIEEGIPSVGAENVIGLGRYDFSKEKFIPQEFFEHLKLKGAAVRAGDVLLYKDGAQIGRKTYFDCDFPHTECAINEHAFILRAKRPELQRFLFFWLDQDWVTHEIISLNSNSAQPGINQTGVRSLPILAPSSDAVGAFDQLSERFIRRLFSNCLESRTLAALRDTFLPKLISGEIRVKGRSAAA